MVPKNDVISTIAVGPGAAGRDDRADRLAGPAPDHRAVGGREVAAAGAGGAARGRPDGELATKPVGVTGTVAMGAVAGTDAARRHLVAAEQAGHHRGGGRPALPNLVGEDINSIQQWAGGNNIHLQPTTVQSNQPQGIIVSQSIAPGTPVAPGSTVTSRCPRGRRRCRYRAT